MAGLLAGLLAGCALKETHRLPPSQILPLQQASLDELLARLRTQHYAVRSLEAEVELTASTGSAYSGVIEEYRDIRAFILAQHRTQATSSEPGGQTRIRVIGQAPLVQTNVFDMVADEQEFRIYVPPKNKFIIGRTAVERRSEKPVENLRPQHLVEALFVEPPAPPGAATHLLEENEAEGMRYYVVTELLTETATLRVGRKWWFLCTNLALTRAQRFGPGGELLSDVHYDEWTQHGPLRYPHWIRLVRLHDDYQLGLRFQKQKLDLNTNFKPEKFRLEPPADADLVDLTGGEKTPAAASRPQPQP